MDKETKFEIDICRDCIYYLECTKIDKFKCKYTLTYKELKDRLKEWFTKGRNK